MIHRAERETDLGPYVRLLMTGRAFRGMPLVTMKLAAHQGHPTTYLPIPFTGGEATGLSDR